MGVNQAYQPVKRTTKSDDVVLVIIPIVVGIALGFSWIKSLIYTPKSLANQFSFQNCDLLKYLLAAAATTMLLQSIVSVIWSEQFKRVDHARENPGALGVLLGGLTFGVGMAFCGASVGTMYAQMGTGIDSGAWVLFGVVLGVLFFGAFHPYVFDKCQKKGQHDKKRVYIDDMIDESRCQYWYVALPLAAILGGCVFLLEEFSPSKTKHFSWAPTFRAEWPPVYTGLIVGGFAALLKVATGQTIGALGSILSLISVPFTPLFAKCGVQLPPLFQENKDWRGLWQFFMLVAASLTSLVTAEDLHILGRGMNAEIGWAIGGGFLMAIGGLLADGDLHSICVGGIADLKVSSFLGMISIFVGGGLAGSAAYFLGGVDDRLHLRRSIYS